MQCPTCGANVYGRFCDYCGTKLPAEQVETQTYRGQHVTVNNYYYPQQPSQPVQPTPPSRTPAEIIVPVAQPVYVRYERPVSEKSRAAALILCFIFGIFGIHRFYLGRPALGLLYLFTLGLLGIGWVLDLGLILLGMIKDSRGLPVRRW